MSDAPRQPSADRRQELKLSESLTLLFEECRMVLPGIQALFGFQLIAVFNAGFSNKLLPWQQALHLAATVLIVGAIALVMAPASLHRRAEQHQASERFLRVGSRLLLAAMVPLAVAISLELFLVASVILHGLAGAAVLAGSLLLVLSTMWLLFPVLYRARSASGLVVPGGGE